jgi:uncharacterized protein (TIGR00730 family)
MKSICVFCGSNPGTNPIYVATAKALGEELVRQDLSLVYGGASVGLMGTLADSVLKAGGQVFGVIPEMLQMKEIAHQRLTKLYVVASMHERKQMMFDLSDGFITLPGGLGSIEEMCEVLTWGQLGLHKKPCGFLNTNQFYSPMISQFERCVQEGMMKEQHREMIIVDPTPAGLIEKLRTYQPPDVEKWMNKKQT